MNIAAYSLLDTVEVPNATPFISVPIYTVQLLLSPSVNLILALMMGRVLLNLDDYPGITKLLAVPVPSAAFKSLPF